MTTFYSQKNGPSPGIKTFIVNHLNVIFSNLGNEEKIMMARE